MARDKPSSGPVSLPPVRFTAAGDSEGDRAANLEKAQQIPGFADATLLVADAIGRRVETVMLDFTREAVAMRYRIDGLWHDLPRRDRPSGDALLASLKCLAGLNPNERRAPQRGRFKVSYLKQRGPCTLTSQGVKTGERVLLEMLGDPAPLETLQDLGMRDKMRQRVKELINSESGIVIISSVPHGGLTTTWTACLNAADRFVRDFVSVQSQQYDDPEVINVNPITYNSAAGQTPASILPQVLLREPNVLAVPEPTDAQTVRILCEQAADEGRMVITRVHARRAEEALFQVLGLNAPADKFAEAILMVLNVRLVRKLCDQCKQPYTPAPQLLQKLGIPPGRVRLFYRPFQPPPPGQVDEKGRPVQPQICPHCNGLGYRGRTGIFELLVVDEALRQGLIEQLGPDMLRQIARQSGQHSLQEEGILLICQGITSLAEVQRVLKQ